MKKFRKLLICVIMLAVMIVIPISSVTTAYAEGADDVNDNVNADEINTDVSNAEDVNIAENTVEINSVGWTFTKDKIVYCVTIPDTKEQYGYVTIISNKLSKSVTELKIPIIVSSKGHDYYINAIGDAAFAFSNLEKIELPFLMGYIGKAAFYGSTQLKEIELGVNVQSIGQGAFSYCNSLENVTLHKNNPYLKLKKGVIYDYKCITLICAITATDKITLPSTVKEILPYAFEGNNRVTRVVCNEGLITIGENAFYDCSSITRIDISSTVSEINGNPFKYCNSLTAIRVNKDNENYYGKSDRLISKDKKTLIAYPSASGEVEIPSNIKNIAEYAFCGANALTKVTIHKKVKSINSGAFYDCNALSEVVFESVKTNLINEKEELIYKIFGNTDVYMTVILPYSNTEQYKTFEASLRANAPKRVIIVNR